MKFLMYLTMELWDPGPEPRTGSLPIRLWGSLPEGAGADLSWALKDDEKSTWLSVVLVTQTGA